MKESNLIKKIGSSLGTLALGMFVGSGICYPAEINPQGYKIPDVNDTSTTDSRDFTHKDGKKYHIDVYEIKKDVFKVSVKGKVFVYRIDDLVTGETYAIADTDGDGIFETKYNEKEVELIDKAPSKLNLPPKWVFE